MMFSGRAGWCEYLIGSTRSNKGSPCELYGETESGEELELLARHSVFPIVADDGDEWGGPSRGFGSASGPGPHRVLASRGRQSQHSSRSCFGARLDITDDSWTEIARSLDAADVGKRGYGLE